MASTCASTVLREIEGERERERKERATSGKEIKIGKGHRQNIILV